MNTSEVQSGKIIIGICLQGKYAGSAIWSYAIVQALVEWILGDANLIESHNLWILERNYNASDHLHINVSEMNTPLTPYPGINFSLIRWLYNKLALLHEKPAKIHMFALIFAIPKYSLG